jgi:hypothetical protein
VAPSAFNVRSPLVQHVEESTTMSHANVKAPNTVVSRDGTEIGYFTSGDGPAYAPQREFAGWPCTNPASTTLRT